MKKIFSIKLSEAQKLAGSLAGLLRGGEIIALTGPLGAGKTTFTKALAKKLKIKTKITSPTFTLMHRHSAKITGKKIFFYHLDLYRLKNFREAGLLGLEEFWGRPDTITVIEWADKIKHHWPKKIIVIKFSH